jgi:hypothetical protein
VSLATKSAALPSIPTNKWAYIALIVLSSAVGLYLFFLNVSTATIADNDYDLYAVFSQALFQSNYSYIAESILLPLIAKLVGANGSGQNYRLLCSFITLLILPLLAICAQHTLRNLAKTLFFLLLFSCSFRYLWAYQLGFPDPLTILLITIAAATNGPLLIFFSIFLAALSHFSMAAVAAAALLVLQYAQSQKLNLRSEQTQAMISIVLGLLAGRCFLSIWYFVFEYHLHSRAAIVVENGFGFFFDLYDRSKQVFWLTPGIPFLAIFLTIVSFWIYEKKYKLALGLALALSLAYVGMFFTTDGLRVFAVIVSGVYVRAIMLSVDAVYPIWHKVYWGYYTKINAILFRHQITARFVLAGSIIAIGWCIVLNRAKGKGLFINHSSLMTEIIGQFRIFDILLIGAGTLIFFAIVLCSWYKNKKFFVLAKTIFFAPLVFIAIQFLRQKLAPNEAFTLTTLMGSVVFMIGIPFAFAKISLLRPFEAIYQRTTGFLHSTVRVS